MVFLYWVLGVVKWNIYKGIILKFFWSKMIDIILILGVKVNFVYGILNGKNIFVF